MVAPEQAHNLLCCHRIVSSTVSAMQSPKLHGWDVTPFIQEAKQHFRTQTVESRVHGYAARMHGSVACQNAWQLQSVLETNLKTPMNSYMNSCLQNQALTVNKQFVLGLRKCATSAMNCTLLRDVQTDLFAGSWFTAHEGAYVSVCSSPFLRRPSPFGMWL